MEAPTSYQIGIMLANGCYIGNRFAVRSIDRFICENVQDVFGTSIIELQSHGATQYCIKSANVQVPSLDDVAYPADFIRAWAELKGGITPIKQHRRHVVGFRVFGPEYILRYIQEHAKIAPKRLNPIRNAIPGGYTGETLELRLQMRDTEQFLDYINGFPCNPSVWAIWDARMKRIREMDNFQEAKQR